MRTKLLLLGCLIATLASAQSRRSGEILLQLTGDASIGGLSAQLQRSTGVATTAAELAPRWRIFRLQFDETALSGRTPEAFLQQVRGSAGVAAAQWNHEVDERNLEPNDTRWSDQVDLRLIGLPSAWENTTGGVTPAGDTIVVAVLEKGMQQEHPDLLPNLFVNRGEIPGNGLDDDGNGYRDDYRGWNASAGFGYGNGNGSSHGTSVHGIIGAAGNNSQGVTGVNWHVKLLPIVNVSFESEIIAAYQYAGEMRRLYAATNGAKGAFVVATNASFGIDNAKAQDYPLWCAVYDSLGVLGVLNVAATANKNVDVDVSGDMPTTCTSEYLITVTNLDASVDRKATNAGYGSVSIDIGAPGSGSFTTVNTINNSDGSVTQYAAFGGTSAACPHVTGAVALLYSVACDGFVADAFSAPSQCVKRVRDALLSNARANTTLEDITTTGARLDVAATVEEVMELCPGTVGDLDVLDIRPNPVSHILQVRYQTPDYEPVYEIQIFNILGQLITVYDTKGDQTGATFAPPSFEAKIKMIDVRNLVPGTYVVVLRQGDKLVSRKFLKI